MAANQKYELTGTSKVNAWGITVYQIRATQDIPGTTVKAGDRGGWIQGETLTNGNARVSGNAWVSGNAQVYGNAQVSGNARVSGNAQVERLDHFLVVSPIGSQGVTATLFRTKNNKHTLVVGCWTGTLGTLSAEVKHRRETWGVDEATADRWAAQYKALKMLGVATVAGWNQTDADEAEVSE